MNIRHIDHKKLSKDPILKQKLDKIVNEQKIEFITKPRENSYLLVLDLDRTLWHHDKDSLRPYALKFISKMHYYKFDIAIWSKRDLKSIKETLKDSKIDTLPICFILTKSHMISISGCKVKNTKKTNSKTSNKIKPLKYIWKKFPDRWNKRNTIHIDDLSGNFILNPGNGLEIQKFDDKNKKDDKELLHLIEYLRYLKKNNANCHSKNNHDNWKRKSWFYDSSDGSYSSSSYSNSSSSNSSSSSSRSDSSSSNSSRSNSSSRSSRSNKSSRSSRSTKSSKYKKYKCKKCDRKCKTHHIIL